MEWSIQQLAREAGTTSRTLRYYGEVGVLPPSRVGENGYRYYDERCLLRLQRILHLRELGLGVAQVAAVLTGDEQPAAALEAHLAVLEEQRRRVDRQIASVRTTLRKLEGGEPLVPGEVLDGFDHTQYRDEVVSRWGAEAYDRGDRWWRSLDEEGRRRHREAHDRLAEAYGRARAAGKAAEDDDVQELARRHVEWLSATATPSRAYLRGLGAMLAADPRFARNYDRYAAGTAELVRDALAVYGERCLRE